MRKLNLIILSLLLIVFFNLSSCASSKPEYKMDLQVNFDRGVELFEKEKYYKAIDFFTFVVFNSPGSEIADDAQLYLGNCHFGLKEYIVAVDEYKRLINRWPASELVETARYKSAQALYELSPHYTLYQENTEAAIIEYQSFIEDYPGSEFRDEAENTVKELKVKLAQKVYDSGMLYMVFREWDAAIITFEKMEENYFDSEIIDLAYLKMAQCYHNLENEDKKKYYLSLIQEENIKKAKDKILLNSLK